VALGRAPAEETTLEYVRTAARFALSPNVVGLHDHLESVHVGEAAEDEMALAA